MTHRLSIRCLLALALFLAAGAVLAFRAEKPAGGAALPRAKTGITLELSNPLPVPRVGEAVILSLAGLPELRQALRGVPVAAVRAAKKVRPAQVDDLNGDGEPDEVAFLADLPPDGRRRVKIETPAPPGLDAAPKVPLDADVLPAGVGGLYLVSGEGLIQVAGRGGGAVEGDTVSRRVLASGPVRAVVEITLAGLKGPGGACTLTRRFSAVAGGPHATEKLTLTGGTALAQVALGMAKLPGAPLEQQVMPPLGCVSLWGKPDRPGAGDAGGAGLALFFPTENLLKIGSGTGDHLVYLHLRPGEPLSLAYAAQPAKESRFHTAREWHEAMKSLAERLAEPIEVSRAR